MDKQEPFYTDKMGKNEETRQLTLEVVGDLSAPRNRNTWSPKPFLI